MSDYQDRKQARINRLKELAEKNEQKSNDAFEDARKTVEHIPFGQPILVGHHSERGHRNLLSKMDNKMRQSVELSNKSDYYTERAKAAENSTAISSDDPEALTLLKTKLERLEKKQQFMKDCNKILKSKKLDRSAQEEQLAKLGINEKSITDLFTPDCFNSIGFPRYALTNNNARLKSVKKRIAQLKKQATEETTEKEINGVRVVDNTEDNRLQLFFDGKPSPEIRTQLKRNGFRWSRFNSCWQSYRGIHQNNRAESILSTL